MYKAHYESVVPTVCEVASITTGETQYCDSNEVLGIDHTNEIEVVRVLMQAAVRIEPVNLDRVALDHALQRIHDRSPKYLGPGT